jgi:hypothetical protein
MYFGIGINVGDVMVKDGAFSATASMSRRVGKLGRSRRHLCVARCARSASPPLTRVSKFFEICADEKQ